MDRPTRRRFRWRPARADFLTWALSSVWDAVGRLVADLQDLKTAARRPHRRRAPAVWFGSWPANS